MSGPSAHLTVKDFDPECFAIEKYVEKLAQLNPQTGLGPLSKSRSKPFEPKVLLESFQESIHQLGELAERNHRRVVKLEQVCVRQEKDHTARIRDLESTYQDAFNEFQVLEDRITYVATKVVHLGDQLETSNNRRLRGVEAQSLMKILGEFEHKAKPPLPVFTDPARKLEAADLVFKLYILSVELPTSEKYETVRRNISEKYAEMEKQLVDAFIEAQSSLDTRRMKQYARALQPFSYGSSKVIDNYIHHSIPPTQYASAEHMIDSVEKLCKKVHDQMVEIFDNPDTVMTKFVQVVIDRVLQKHIDGELGPLVHIEEHQEKYLKKLHDLYGKTMRLQEKLSKYKMSIDPSFLSKMTRVSLFSKYLSSYRELEIAHLQKHSSLLLVNYNEAVGIAKRSVGASRYTISAQNPEETYISQEVCTSLLYEAKEAVRRADTMLVDKDLSDLVAQVYFTVLDKLCAEHFHTALDIGWNMDPKSAPTGLFCMIVGNINSNMHLIEKLCREVIMPCIHYPPVATACVERKRQVTQKLEAKIEAGIERTISGMVGSVKQLLSTYQKKTDYKPEVPSIGECTQACSKVVSYVSESHRVLRSSLDGKNLEVVLLEFGIRLHRVIYDHIQQFSINETGAMVIICDMNEYRRIVKDFKNPFLDELFETMQTLCNIFIIKAENLSQVCSEEPYVNFDRSILQGMMQLRADYKTAKIGKQFSA